MTDFDVRGTTVRTPFLQMRGRSLSYIGRGPGGLEHFIMHNKPPELIEEVHNRLRLAIASGTPEGDRAIAAIKRGVPLERENTGATTDSVHMCIRALLKQGINVSAQAQYTTFPHPDGAYVSYGFFDEDTGMEVAHWCRDIRILGYIGPHGRRNDYPLSDISNYVNYAKEKHAYA